MEEWSGNLDFENLKPVLQTLAKCIERGFGAQEIAEVIGVAEEMKPNQTKTFRFDIAAKGRESELWLVIFMDEIDSPDLEKLPPTDVGRRPQGQSFRQGNPVGMLSRER